MRGTTWRIWSLVLLCGLFLAQPMLAQQQDHDSPAKDQAPAANKDQGPSPTNRLTVEVTGGDSNKPIENASVYVKTIEQHLIKDKKFEVNVKTNPNGTAHVPDAPLGKILIQVVADGWKPYGHWYEVTDPKQVIKVHLERPPKWY